MGTRNVAASPRFCAIHVLLSPDLLTSLSPIMIFIMSARLFTAFLLLLFVTTSVAQQFRQTCYNPRPITVDVQMKNERAVTGFYSGCTPRSPCMIPMNSFSTISPTELSWQFDFRIEQDVYFEKNGKLVKIDASNYAVLSEFIMIEKRDSMTNAVDNVRLANFYFVDVPSDRSGFAFSAQSTGVYLCSACSEKLFKNYILKLFLHGEKLFDVSGDPFEPTVLAIMSSSAVDENGVGIEQKTCNDNYEEQDKWLNQACPSSFSRIPEYSSDIVDIVADGEVIDFAIFTAKVWTGVVLIQ